MPESVTVIYPSQCSCGHLFLERYELGEPNAKGEVGFCWCGFCRTKLMVKPYTAGRLPIFQRAAAKLKARREARRAHRWERGAR